VTETWNEDAGGYTRTSAFLVMRVTADASVDGWRADVIIRGRVVHSSEHGSRDDAMRAADSAGRRAVQLRRFEIDPPSMP
jgi:hypothetical protein